MSGEEAVERLKREAIEAMGLEDPGSLGEAERELVNSVRNEAKEELLARLVPSLAATAGTHEEPLFPLASGHELEEWWRGWERGTWARSDGRAGWGVGGGQPRWMGATQRPTLEALGSWLATIYPWRPTDAVWFVLTGEPPEAVGLELSYDRQRNLFTLVFATWISEGTARRAHHGARDHLGRGDNRPLSDKTLEVLRFVAEQTEERGKRPPWEELRKLWNRRRPGDKKRRFDSIQGLREAYLRAAKLLGILEASGRIKRAEDTEYRTRIFFGREESDPASDNKEDYHP